MRVLMLRLAALFGLLLTAACGDSPMLTADTEAAPNLTTVVMPDEEHQAPACCDPIVVIVDGPDPECNPWESLNWCDGDGGDCMSSVEGFQTTSGCVPPGGGGGPSPCDPTWDPACAPPPGGSGSTGTGGTSETGTGPFADGPMLWAACVVALVGGTWSVEVVGDKFGAWYDAHKDLVRARNALDHALDLQRRGEYVDPSAIELAYYRLDVAVDARDAAVGAVEEATGVSILTLIGAGFACGAAAAAPTP